MQSATATDATGTDRPGGSPDCLTDGADDRVCVLHQQAVELVGRRWTGAIISALLERPRRFCEIGAAVPDLSDRLLSQRLRELEERGMVEHVPCPERASSVRYGLTPMGRDLAPALEALRSWAHRWLADETQ